MQLNLSDTTTNLIETYDYVTKALDSGRSLDVIYLDFSKSFDKIPTTRLIEKLSKLSIPEYIVDWINVFVTGRTQRVQLRGRFSLQKEIGSGVPQAFLGSGVPAFFPLFYLIYT